MNWGWSIVLAFSLFGLFIGWLVFRTFQVNVDLVSKDYYQQELNYQQQIDKIVNTRALSVPLTFAQEGQRLIVQFPQRPAGEVSGQIQFFRPSDARADRMVTIALNAQRQATVATNHFARGYYKVKVHWTSDETDYFTEQAIFIQP